MKEMLILSFLLVLELRHGNFSFYHPDGIGPKMAITQF